MIEKINRRVINTKKLENEINSKFLGCEFRVISSTETETHMQVKDSLRKEIMSEVIKFQDTNENCVSSNTEIKVQKNCVNSDSKIKTAQDEICVSDDLENDDSIDFSAETFKLAMHKIADKTKKYGQEALKMREEFLKKIDKMTETVIFLTSQNKTLNEKLNKIDEILAQKLDIAEFEELIKKYFLDMINTVSKTMEKKEK